MKVFCGIDLGTTNSKGIVLDEKGNILSIITMRNPSDTKKVFWYDYFEMIMDQINSEGIFESNEIYCSVTSQGGSFVLIDDNNKPVSQMNLWTDIVTGQENAEKYIEEHGSEEFYRITGWLPKGWLPIFKIGIANERNFSKIAFVPDYIYAQLTGFLVTDIENAQITGLCDFKNHCWNNQLMEWAGITRNNLPAIVDSLKVVFENVETKWGMLNLVTSSHDQYAAMNCFLKESNKEILLATGTAWVINYRTSDAIYDKSGNLHPGYDLAANTYGNISTIGTHLGKTLDDFLARLNISYSELKRLELKIDITPCRPNNILPIRTNKKLSESEKIFYVKSQMSMMAAAVKEHLKDICLLSDLKNIILTGGAANSVLLPQLIADYCNARVEAIIFSELTAYGAALMAAQAVGLNFKNDIGRVCETKIYKPKNVPVQRLSSGATSSLIT